MSTTYATKQIGTAVAASFEQAQAQATRVGEQLVSLGQGNLAALVQSGQAWAAGLQDLSRQVAANARAQLGIVSETTKALASAKSFQQAVELQTGLVRGTAERGAADAARLTEASLTLAQQVAAPLQARAVVAVQTFAKAA